MTGTRAAGAARTETGGARAGRSAPVADLRPRERMVFDQARLVAVCDAQGTGAEAFIGGVLDAVERGIAAAAGHAEDPAALARDGAEVARLADEIGMTTMGQASRALLDCLAQTGGDGPGARTARMACLQRLVRLGRPSGTAGWRVSDDRGPDPVA